MCTPLKCSIPLVSPCNLGVHGQECSLTSPPSSPTAHSFLNTGKGVALMGLCIFSGGGYFITKLSGAVENPNLQQALSLLLVFWCVSGVGMHWQCHKGRLVSCRQPIHATLTRSIFTLKTTYTYAKQAWNGPTRQQAIEEVCSPACTSCIPLAHTPPPDRQTFQFAALF